MENTENKRVMLDDEELEQVSGGSFEELASDSELLFRLGQMESTVSVNELATDWQTQSKKVVLGWKLLGIRCEPSARGKNRYFMSTQEVSREALLQEYSLHLN